MHLVLRTSLMAVFLNHEKPCSPESIWAPDLCLACSDLGLAPGGGEAETRIAGVAER